MRIRSLAPAGLAAVALVAVACGSSSGSGNNATSNSPAANSAPGGSSASGNVLKTTTISGVKVLTNSKGLTLYWFVPDTSTTSKCTGSCATYWPPVKGPATAGPGVTGKLGTIKRSDGTLQATYNGHPLYTYAADTAPGQAKGNGINASGGVWHEVTASGAAPSPHKSKSSSGGGGGYGY